MQFSSINPIRCYHSRPAWTWEWWQWRGALHSSKPQYHWIVTIILFSVISRTFIEGGLTLLQKCSWCILQPQPAGQVMFRVGKQALKRILPTKPLERRCPWCSRYRRRKWTRRYEFKSWTKLIAFHIALIPLGKVWIQLFSLQLWVNSRID